MRMTRNRKAAGQPEASSPTRWSTRGGGLSQKIEIIKSWSCPEQITDDDPIVIATLWCLFLQARARIRCARRGMSSRKLHRPVVTSRRTKRPTQMNPSQGGDSRTKNGGVAHRDLKGQHRGCGWWGVPLPACMGGSARFSIRALTPRPCASVLFMGSIGVF